MTKFFLKTIFLTGLLFPLTGMTQENTVKADVGISIQKNQGIWTGQQVTVNLDLKTSGISFSDSHFDLPEVPGAFLIRTDTTTIKSTENIGGETWQVIRYPLALYPEKAGQLEIPPIAVRFSASAGIGENERAFEFQTKVLQLTVKSPPGVQPGDLVITTTSFELDHDWQPVSGTAFTGDALTLTVTRRAKNISAMLLPPLPVYRAKGLATYPQAPQINDKTNRGDLTGERIDSIIWVIEKPGTYDIPGIRFQWWDPDKQKLKQQIIPGRRLDILPSPRDSGAADSGDQPELPGQGYWWPLVAIFTAFVAVFLWFRFGSMRPGKTPEQTVDTEKSTFATLRKACKRNQPVQTHSAMHAWLASYSRALTLSEFARACDDLQLTTELQYLQEALVSSPGTWSGAELLGALQRIRHKLNGQKIVQSKVHLAPLNP